MMFSSKLIWSHVHNAFMTFFLVSFVLLLKHTMGKFSVEIPAQQSQVDGVVLSMRPERFNHTQHVLHQIGLHVVQKLPLHFQSPEVNQSLTAFQGRSHHSERSLKVWSNQMAFVDAMKKFILESESTPRRWRFFFEDDLALHPDVSPEKAPGLISRGLEAAEGEKKAEGIVYLGICGPRCAQKRVDLGESMEASVCHGTCAHAFGFQVRGAEAFLRWLESEQVKRNMYMDQNLFQYGRDVKGVLVIGSNLQSPADRSHFGVLYQDRLQFPTTIG